MFLRQPSVFCTEPGSQEALRTVLRLASWSRAAATAAEGGSGWGKGEAGRLSLPWALFGSLFIRADDGL